jgi:surface antigen
MTSISILRTACAAAALLCLSAPAFADMPQFGGDDGYQRLAHWEDHIDQRIHDRVRHHALTSDRAWRFQKRLDDDELRTVQAHFEGLDRDRFLRIAGDLRQIGSELGDQGWAQPEWDQHPDARGSGYGPPPPPPPGNDHNYGPPPGGNYPPPPPNYGPPPGGNYPPPPDQNYGQGGDNGGPGYREGYYEDQCRHGNSVAGTIFGAAAGGLIGGAVSHGNGAAVAGGVVLGGVLGNALSSDLSCEDHRYAFATYSDAFNGPLNREYRWEHGPDHGTVVVNREYSRGDSVCRDFHVVNYRDGRRSERDGTTCRDRDGAWRMQ